MVDWAVEPIAQSVAEEVRGYPKLVRFLGMPEALEWGERPRLVNRNHNSR